MLTKDGLELAIATQKARQKLGELDVTLSIEGFIELSTLAVKGCEYVNQPQQGDILDRIRQCTSLDQVRAVLDNQ